MLRIWEEERYLDKYGNDEKGTGLKADRASEESLSGGFLYLDYNQAWKLLVGVRLAAQCTDERVNIVTEKLYKKFPDVDAWRLLRRRRLRRS